MHSGFGRDNVDDFFVGEMENIDGGENKPALHPQMSDAGKKCVSSKFNLGFRAGKNAGGVLVKPMFSISSPPAENLLWAGGILLDILSIWIEKL